MINGATPSELRKMGIDAIEDVRWGTHSCYFYETKGDLVETLVPYFKAGLENKEFCVWVLPEGLDVEEATNALRQGIPDLERSLAKGALEIHCHDRWYLTDGRWDPKRVLRSWGEKLTQASSNGYTGLRASGDGGWVPHDDWSVFRDYEKEVNTMIAGQRTIVLCTYPLTTTPGDQVFDAAHIHHMAVARRNGNWEILEAPAVKEAKIEIKRLNEQLEEKVKERTKELAATNEVLRAEIAERKSAEAAVKQAEDRVRLVIDTIPTMAWSLRPDGLVDFVNQPWIEYTGLSREEALEDSSRIVHPDDLPGALEKWASNMAAGNLHEAEMRLRGADGKYRWFLIRVSPLRDARKEIVKWYGVATDIEDRKQAEMETRALIDAIPQQIWSGPADGTNDYVNDRWRSETGLELEETQGDGWQTLVHPEDRDRVLKAWRHSVQNGTPYEQEERHRRADGTYRWYLNRGVPLRDNEGRIVRWYGTNTDIEDRKRAEKKLLQSERQLAEAQRLAHIGSWDWDLRTNAVTWSEELYHIFGLEPGTISVAGEVDRFIHPQDLELGWDTVKRAVASKEPYDYYHRILKPDGTERIARSRGSIISDERGEPIRVFGATQDVTELKRAEEKLKETSEQLRALIDAIPQQIWSAPPDGKTDYCNERWRSYTGLELEDLRGYGWQTMLHPDDRDRVLKAWHESVANGTPYEQEERHRGTDGTYRWFLSLSVPLHDAEGRIVRWYGTNTDIEDRKRAEETLWQSLSLLRAISEGTIDAMYAKDREGRYLMINTAGARFEGKTPEEIIGLDDTQLFSGETLAKILERDRAIMETGGTRTDEDIVTTPDGRSRVHLTTKGPLRDPAGTIIGLFGVSRDITENKRAEQALRESEQRFRELAENINEVFWLSDDQNARMHYISPAYEKVWGRSCASLYAAPRSWMDAVHPEDKERVLANVAKRSLKEAYYNTYRILRPDGSIRWIRDRGFPVRDESGVAVRFAGIAEDITSQKQIEEALRESEQQMRLFMEATADCLWKWDLITGEVVRSVGFHRVFGYAIEEVDSTVAWWEERLHPDDRAKVIATFQDTIASGGNACSYEYQFRCKDGTLRLIQDRAYIVRDARGKPLCALGAMTDITERKKAEDELRRSEEKFKTLFGIAPVGIAVLDSQRNLLDVNPALSQITRLSREELLRTRDTRRTILNADGRPISPEQWPSARALRENRVISNAETGVVMENGETVWLEVSVAPLALPDARAVVITQDITERKRAAKELEEANRQLRVLSRQLFHLQEEERRHLARELHDEIGQILTVAKINLKLIAADVPEKTAGRLQDSVKLLDRLLIQVRQLSLDLRPPLLDELGLVPTLRWLVDQQAQRAGLRVTFNANVDGLEIDSTVQIACFRVAQEAITNAIRHAAARNVYVRLRETKERLRLSVRDDGVGFDPVMIQQRGRQHATLGLVSMKERALLAGGGLEIHSARDKGTEIRAWFPLSLKQDPNAKKG